MEKRNVEIVHKERTYVQSNGIIGIGDVVTDHKFYKVGEVRRVIGDSIEIEFRTEVKTVLSKDYIKLVRKTL